MILRGIDLGNICNGSGALGFFNEDEYWYQVLLKKMRIPYKKGLGFVSKTTTLDSNPGNMALTKDYKPAHWYPDCIEFDFLNGNGLNAVGVSGPGLKALLDTGKWQACTEPFCISVMSLKRNANERLDEFRKIVDIVGPRKKEFRAPIGWEVNLSCPNTGEEPSKVIKDSANILQVMDELGDPLIPKYSVASAPIEAIMELNNNPNCDAICVSNTWPYDFQGLGRRIFGRKISPLARFGGGGISGKALRKLVCPWISELRMAGFTKPIRGGGGIFSCATVRQFSKAGASSCFISSVIPERPWLVPGIINCANTLTSWRKP